MLVKMPSMDNQTCTGVVRGRVRPMSPPPAVRGIPLRLQLEYATVRKAVVQGVSWTSDKHQQCFRILKLTEVGCPLVFAQHHKNSCSGWMLAEEWDAEGILDLVMLEQFIAWLPAGTAEYVQCH